MVLHPTIQLLLDEIDEFRSKAGLSASAFGRASVNDPNLVGDLLKGRMPSLLLVDRVRAFIHVSAASQPARRKSSPRAKDAA